MLRQPGGAGEDGAMDDLRHPGGAEGRTTASGRMKRAMNETRVVNAGV